METSVMKAASTGGGGVGGGTSNEPELKRRRLLDAGGAIEDDETARQKMRDANVRDHESGETTGFDPEKTYQKKFLQYYPVTPMGYFASKGDLPMMRWLYVNGADSSVRGDEADCWFQFPMYMAALYGQLDACKWIFAHGAAQDIKRGVHTILSAIFDESDQRNVSRWLILKGALCKDDDTGEIELDLITKARTYHGSARELPELLMWAREHHQCRSAFGVFLMGTLSILEYSNTKLRHAFLARIRSEKVVDRILRNTPPDQYRLLWDELFPQRVCCSLAALCGKSGILELIGDYVGIMRGREARIIRQLTDLLPGVIAELDAKRAQSNLEADSNDDSDDDNDGSDGSDGSDDFYESDA